MPWHFVSNCGCVCACVCVCVWQHGKDFDAIQNVLTQKLKKRCDSDTTVKTKEQIRHFYYRTWHKISSYVNASSVEGWSKFTWSTLLAFVSSFTSLWMMFSPIFILNWNQRDCTRNWWNLVLDWSKPVVCRLVTSVIGWSPRRKKCKCIRVLAKQWCYYDVTQMLSFDVTKVIKSFFLIRWFTP